MAKQNGNGHNGQSATDELAELRKQRAEVAALIEKDAAPPGRFDFRNMLGGLAARAERESRLAAARDLLAELDGRIAELQPRAEAEQEVQREARVLALVETQAAHLAVIFKALEGVIGEVKKLQQIHAELFALGAYQRVSNAPAEVAGLQRALDYWRQSIAPPPTAEERQAEQVAEIQRQLDHILELRKAVEARDDANGYYDKKQALEGNADALVNMSLLYERTAGRWPSGVPVRKPAPPKPQFELGLTLAEMDERDRQAD